MRTKKMLLVILSLAALSTINSRLSTVFAQGTAFTYQGRLNGGGNPANGNYDLQFAIYDAATGGSEIAGPLTNVPTGVTNGLFIVTLDFDNGVFTGPGRWLEVGVRTNGSVAAYAILSPRQPLTPAPYAITAGNVTGSVPAAQLTGMVPSSALAGTYSNAVALSNPSNSFAGNGGGLAGVNALSLDGLNSSNFWRTTGNAGTSPANGSFLGTTDNQPLELWANGTRALRMEPNASGAPNFIAGSLVNFVMPGTVGAVIAGGGATNYNNLLNTSNTVAADFGSIGGGVENQVQTQSYLSTIAGGGANLIEPFAHHSTIGGGGGNQIQTNAYLSTIAGGYVNLVQANAAYAAIGGGASNTASGVGSFIGGGGYDGTAYAGNENAGIDAVITGGFGNEILPGADYSMIGGGQENQISNNATGATIVGGQQNQIGSGAGDCMIGGGSGNLIAAGAGGSSITGGYYNAINSAVSFATIGGGQGNKNSANSATIGGGNQNQNSGYEGTIGGGGINQIQTSSDCTIGGGSENIIQPGAFNSTIGGGVNNMVLSNGWESTVGGGNGNQIQANATDSTIGGGEGNQIQTLAGFSAIGGGGYNQIQSHAYDSGIFAGEFNTIQPNAWYSTISGGYQNVVSAPGSFIGGGGYDGSAYVGNVSAGNAAVIGGGLANLIHTNSPYATIGGGSSNVVSGTMGTVPGGDQNVAGAGAFAAGHRAKANDQGSFVWADSTDADFSDFGSNTFNVRASGGVVFTSGGGGANETVSWTPGTGSWSFTSDRNAKENFQPVNARQVLEKVAKLPLTEWNYKGYGDRHVGPMAQDFHAAFPFNASDKMLNSADEAGVSLAAIQGLNEKLDEKDAEIQHLKQQNDSLAERLNKLETTVKQLAAAK